MQVKARTKLRLAQGLAKERRLRVHDRGTTTQFPAPTLPVPIGHFAHLQEAVSRAYPQAEWHTYEAVDRNNVREGARLAFSYVGDKIGERVTKLAAQLDSDIVLPMDVGSDDEISATFLAADILRELRRKNISGRITHVIVLRLVPCCIFIQAAA